MARLNQIAVVEKVHALLRDDAKTKHLKAFIGSRAPTQIKDLQDGALDVFVGSLGDLEPRTMPAPGEWALMTVLLELHRAHHEGAAAAQQALAEDADAVGQVLVNTKRGGEEGWTIGLDYAWPERLVWERIRYFPTASPYYVAVTGELQIRIHPVGA